MKHLIFACALVASPGLADVVTPQGRTIDCYCTDSGGARIELGESICLQVGGRMFTAQCQMSLNVPMWRETQEGCFTSELSPRGFDHPLQSRAIDPKI
ncbi:hypothetical protein KDD17_06135 [Sulfitobacter albidus]|uniref:Uncharacterized protein n=1 Tax=Sulfitobacter albidus TaxID=2829501 RepID=A0A975JFG8_9RHOB|nr:hypothetical protein [Sulfitobacter albidus]QUJ77551.1 hypothetical protein KDD17_06135 [Sulfitobacter albidus]